jgi:YcaO-like protein with predicted kinase domain
MMPIRLFDTEHTAAKAFEQGTHRTRSPRETFEDYKRFMPLMGITRIADVTGLDFIGLPVFTAIRPNARSLSTSQGKGIDADAARTSAMMECMEIWHAEQIDKPLRFDSYASLRRRASVVDVTALPLRKGATLRINEPQLWIEGYDLLQGRPAWVPFDMVTSYYAGPKRAAQHAMNSIGLASGNHLLEAIVHGLCEVIERDAEELYYSTEAEREVHLSTVTDPSCIMILEMLRAAGVHCTVFDITSDVGIPVYTCRIMEPPGQAVWRSLGVYLGSGCHLSPEIALSRALSEAIQARLTQIAGSRDDMLRDTYAEVARPELMEALWKDIIETDPATRHPFVSGRSLASPSFEGDLAILFDALRSVGIQSAIAVDLSKEELGLSVVKVIIPGLEAGTDVAEPGARARALIEASR